MVYSITDFLYNSVQILYFLITVFNVIDASISKVFFSVIFRIISKCSNLVTVCHLLCLNSLTHESPVSNIAVTSGVLFSPRQLPEFHIYFFFLRFKYMKISLAWENVEKWNHSLLLFQNYSYINKLTGSIMINM